jgi:cytochrome c-type protein NapB
MKTRHATLFATALCLALYGLAAAPQEAAKPAADRDVPVEAKSNADSFRVERDRPNIPRDFVQQPPLVPHAIHQYQITKNFNQCLDCHSWARYQEKQATKVSVTHFKDRDGRELSNISPRRYFCTSCHVSQTEAKPLVENRFQPAAGLRP